MHPTLIPWLELSAGTLTVLAYALAVGVAAFVGWLVRGWLATGKSGAWFPAVLAFAGTLVAGAWVIRTKFEPIEAGPLPLHTYGLMLATAFLLAIHVAGREADRSGLMTKAQLNDFAFWVLISAIVGAKALFIVVNWSGPNGYGAHPERIFDLLSGGLVFYGGFIGAALAGVIWAKKNRVDFRVLADVCIPSVALGHFFGRLGCIAAGCCYGKVCHDPHFFLGAEYPRGSGAFAEMSKNPEWAGYIAEHDLTPALHPTQLYEGVGELFLFVLLIYLRPWKRFHGQLLAVWLGLYGVLRLSIEMFRGDWLRGMIFKWPAENPLLLSTSQLIGVGMVTLAVVLWFAWKPKHLPKVDGAGTATAGAA